MYSLNSVGRTGETAHIVSHRDKSHVPAPTFALLLLCNVSNAEVGAGVWDNTETVENMLEQFDDGILG